MPDDTSSVWPMSTAAGTAPLRGVRVVEFVHQVMGPSCGLLLAELGADVIKIEPAGEGDNTRRLIGSGAGLFPAFNRGKRSLAVDLKTEAGIAVAKQVAANADVVTENFRPGAMDRMGLGYEVMRAMKPSLIYCSMKGFLPGPYGERVALDEVVQLMGGLAYMTGPPGQPLRAGTSVNDIVGGLFTAIAVLAALKTRAETGAGQHIQTGLFETCAFLVGQHVAEYCVTGTSPTPMSVPQDFYPVYDRFETKEGARFFLAVVTDRQWSPFCREFGLDELSQDPELATSLQRVRLRSRTLPRIAAAVRKFTVEELTAKALNCGIPFAPIRQPEELLEDPHLRASGGLVATPAPNGAMVQVPALPLAIDGLRVAVARPIPAPGEHSRDILADAGFDATAIAELLRRGVVTEIRREAQADGAA